MKVTPAFLFVFDMCVFGMANKWQWSIFWPMAFSNFMFLDTHGGEWDCIIRVGPEVYLSSRSLNFYPAGERRSQTSLSGDKVTIDIRWRTILWFIFHVSLKVHTCTVCHYTRRLYRVRRLYWENIHVGKITQHRELLRLHGDLSLKKKSWYKTAYTSSNIIVCA
jgi:hypothetical protein